MKNLIFMLAATIVMGSLAHANDAGVEGCYERTYTQAELQKHPGQKVKSIMLMTGSDSKGAEAHILNVTDTDGKAYVLSSTSIETLTSNPMGVYQPSNMNLVSIDTMQYFYETLSSDKQTLDLRVGSISISIPETNSGGGSLVLPLGTLNGYFKLNKFICD